MRIVNTYKQYDITWFGYKTVFAIMSQLQVFTWDVGALSMWLTAGHIHKRTKDTV